MNRETVTYRGRSEQVLDRIRFGSRTLLVVERLSAARDIFRVFDPAGSRQMRRLCILPLTPATDQHLRVIQRVTENDPHQLPILETRPGGEKLLVLQPWIIGQSLAEYLAKARQGRAPVPSAVQAFRLGRGLAHAVSRLHRIPNVIHGDLKPENLLLVRGPNRLVIVDMGSAWTIERTITRSTGDGVSPVYAAPEQLLGGENIDFRADQFSLGTILYELLTLSIPYEGLGGRIAVVRGAEGIALTPPSKISRAPSSLPRELWREVDRVVIRMLAREPSARFGSSSDLLRAIEAADASLRVAANRVGQPRALWWVLDKLFGGPRQDE